MTMNRNSEVDAFMETVGHPQKEAVEYLRAVILEAEPELTEQVKWNAPSFCRDGTDRITFQLKSRDVQLIFHRGVAVKDDAATFSFEDPSGLLKWRTADRGLVTFKDLDDIKAHEEAFVGLVGRWVRA
ncbi:DUF1801 domain-containing protein [Streptomyces indicus]|uniref:YdhG-like domain-containing protein n=1 Tax=Streptomyces indicus TaxID=417292 RepID=A0A1G9JI46_9ACTN|nr:DUF1801 domain-containing protein [Streptomyces indicus]SDL36906.1 hypothetical protein SAMN05421806_1318 [Streptomyces indicus]